MSTPTIFISPTARQSYLALYSICKASATRQARKHDSSSSSGQFRRSDFSGQGFTGYYEAGQPTAGPLGDASAYGAPRITPKVLKHHLDQYVIGQERAKKVLSVAVYNHYQRIQEIQRQQEEEEELLAQQERRAIAGTHPVESEFPGQQTTVNLSSGADRPVPQPLDYTPLQIDKSNVLLLGPSGVGKTLMTKTLARVLEVPFSTSDCTPFTQAGYIGEDAEVCVQRLLAAANYDVEAAERGIICLDEIDKIATAKVSHGKDVSGEGVQQALLKIIEGTVVQVQAKQERSSGGASPSSPLSGRQPNAVPTGSLGQSQPPAKGDVYNVDTSNILFICTGAFVGLHRVVMDRIAKGSMGFGATLGATPSSDINDPSVAGSKANDELFRKHLPFYTSQQDTFASAKVNPSATPTTDTTKQQPSVEDDEAAVAPTYNTLDLTTPTDLQKYGLIPELIGRIPVTCSLSPLSLSALVRVLTEPRNSLVAQYAQLFALSGLELAFTSPALREIARTAQGMGTGARGLRTVMERLLGEAMFEAPGGSTRYVLVTEKVAKKECEVLLFNRGLQGQFRGIIEREEREWRRRCARKTGGREEDAGGAGGGDGFSTFSQYRKKASIAGSA